MITPFVPYFAVASGGGLPSGLVAQWEMDNTTVTASSWVDAVGGINLSTLTGMDTPSIVSGGTPTGEDYYEFTSNDGLGVDDISGTGIPVGSAARTMLVVARYGSNDGNYNGVMYGTNSNDQAFGVTATTAGRPAVDFWGGLEDGSTSIEGTGWHVLTGIYTGTNVRLRLDDVQVAGGAHTLNTGTDAFYIHESIAGTGKTGAVDIAAILIFDSLLSDADHTDAFNYLNDKYVTP